MPFQFSLSALLRLRLSFERREELRLAGATQALAKCDQQLADLAGQEIAFREQLLEAMRPGAPGAELRFQQACLDSAAHSRQQLLGQRQQLVEALERQRRAFQLARRDREILEELRDRQQHEWTVEQDRRSQQSLDDLFAARRAAKIAEERES